VLQDFTEANPNGTETAAQATGTAGTSSQPINTTIDPTAASTTTMDTTSSQDDRGRLQEPAKSSNEERDVSPGTLSDGSHAKTSAEKGEGYEAPRGLNKLKNKMFGKH
jgi:hypothetical protein